MRKRSQEESVERLIEACLRGDRRSQFALYQRYRSMLYGVCLRYADSVETAEDLLQEVFVRVFTRLGQYRGEGSFEGWLRRIAVHASAEHYRNRAKTLPLQELTDLPDEASPWASPDVWSERELLELVQALPDGCRAVFNLYVVEGYAHREIAELLGVSEGASRSQLAYARKKLNQALQELKPQHYVSL